jgi:hypothetical protein
VRVDEIRETLLKRPFRPFDIHLADGRRFPIHHPEFLAINPTGRTIIVADLDAGYEIIDPMLVTSLSVPEVKTEN